MGNGSRDWKGDGVVSPVMMREPSVVMVAKREQEYGLSQMECVCCESSLGRFSK